MAKVPGSTFRRTLFWAHLVSGVLAGIIVLTMSVTAVLLTYERQIIEWAGTRSQVTPAGKAALGATQLADRARALSPQAANGSLVFDADPATPVAVSIGRQQKAMLLDPYTGARVEDAAAGYRDFFRTVENWHRWLGSGPQASASWLVPPSNLLFLFLVLSGIYLWLPAVWKWPILRALMFFSPKYVNSKARDFAWHHVFSVWALIPLFLIVLSGVVMSYPWANSLLYTAYGEQVPQRREGGGGPGGPPGGPPGGAAREAMGARGNGAPGEGTAPDAAAAPRATLDALLAAAQTRVSDWQSITLPLSASGETVSVAIETQSEEARKPRRTLVLNAADASPVSLSEPQGGGNPQQSPAQRARGWFRFVHTGEEYGVIGQTIAGLASLAACFLVYTGFALAYRRLLKPLFRRPAA